MKAYPGRVLILSQIGWAAVSQKQQPAYLSLHSAHPIPFCHPCGPEEGTAGAGCGVRLDVWGCRIAISIHASISNKTVPLLSLSGSIIERIDLGCGINLMRVLICLIAPARAI